MSQTLSTVTSDSEQTIGRRVALISISAGIVLAILKISVGVAAHSNAVVSDGLETAGDVLSSTIVYLGLWLASKPPDAEHPYGHGRYETLAGLAVGGILLLTGTGILWHGLSSLKPRSDLRGYAVYPLFFAAVLKIFLAVLKFRTGNRIGSSSLQTDAWHDVTDLFSTTVALVSVALTLHYPGRFGMADQMGGVVIGIIVLFLSLQVVKNTTGFLLDTMPEPSRMSEIRRVALNVPGTLGIEKCFARRTGMKYHVDLHLEVDPDMTVRRSHEVATEVKKRVKEKLHWVADVLVHVEPSDLSAESDLLRRGRN